MKGKLTYTYLIWIVYILANSTLAFSQVPDSILTKLASLKEDSNKVLLLNQISASLIYKDPNAGLNYATDGAVLANKIQFKSGLAFSDYLIGTIYRLQGNLDSCESYYIQSGKLYKELNNQAGQAMILSSMGGIYLDRQKYNEALGLYYASLKIDRQIKDKAHESLNLQNIALIFSKLKRFDDASNYFKQSAAIKYEIGDKRGESMVYANYGAMLVDQEKWSEAELYLEKAYEIQKEIGDRRIIAVCQLNLGSVYLNKDNRFTEAEGFEKDALNFYTLIGDTTGMVTALNLLGAVYVKTFDYKTAEETYKQALALSVYTDNKIPIKTTYTGLYEVAKRTNKFKDALLYLEEIQKIEKEIYQIKTIEEVAEQKERYESEKRETEIKLLEERNKTSEAVAEKNRFWSILIGIILGTILVVLTFSVILVVVRSRHQRKIKELELLRTKAQLEQKVLRAQMNPHFIFNSLNSIQHYILSNQTEYAYEYLGRFSNLIRQVLSNSEFNTITLRKELDLLRIYIELEQNRFKDRFNYEITHDQNLDIDDIEVPVMLIQPYVENAIWHGIMNLSRDKQGILKVSFTKENDNLKITVEDNGIGREAAEKLKKKDGYDSVGMLFSQKRLDMLKLVSGKDARISITDLYDSNGIAQGTRVDIVLPI